MTSGTALFRQARDTLIEHRTDYERAVATFSWPRLQQFNWALDWFDVIARGNQRPALRIVGDSGDVSLSFEELRQRSNRLANHLRALGLRRGDRILLMLGNVPNLWELMLAAIKLSCPIIPTTTLMMPDDLRDRVERGGAKAIVTEAAYADRFTWLDGSHLKLLAAGQQQRLAVAGRLPLRPERSSYADGPTNAVRVVAAVLHLGHDGQTETRAAHARQLSRRASLDDVLARAAAGRCASEPEQSRLGEARVELVLRALECGSDHRRDADGALRRCAAAARARALRGDELLRAADGVARADPVAAEGSAR